jgi:hypothetical protein
METNVADIPIVHIGENSPENIAFKMMNLIAAVESKEPYGHGENPMTREWIFKTYAQCRRIVNGYGDVEETIKWFDPGRSPNRR